MNREERRMKEEEKKGRGGGGERRRITSNIWLHHAELAARISETEKQEEDLVCLCVRSRFDAIREDFRARRCCLPPPPPTTHLL